MKQVGNQLNRHGGLHIVAVLGAGKATLLQLPVKIAVVKLVEILQAFWPGKFVVEIVIDGGKMLLVLPCRHDLRLLLGSGLFFPVLLQEFRYRHAHRRHAHHAESQHQ